MPNTRSRGGRFWRSKIILSHTMDYTSDRVESQITVRFARTRKLKPKELEKVTAEFRRYLTHVEERCQKEYDPTRTLHAVAKVWRTIPAWEKASASVLRTKLREAGHDLKDHEVRRALTIINQAIADHPLHKRAILTLPIDKARRTRLLQAAEDAIEPGLERLR